MCATYLNGFVFLLQHQYLTEALHWRAQTDADHVLFVLLNAKVWSRPQSSFFFTIASRVRTSVLSLSYRGQQWAQRPACSYTSVRRRLQLHSQRKAASTLERMWCCSTLPVSPATVLLCVFEFWTFFSTQPVCTISFAGIDLIAAFYGCLYAGCVPVNVRPPHPQNLAATLPTVRMIIDVCLSTLVHAPMQYFALTDLFFFRSVKPRAS